MIAQPEGQKGALLFNIIFVVVVVVAISPPPLSIFLPLFTPVLPSALCRSAGVGELGMLPRLHESESALLV